MKLKKILILIAIPIVAIAPIPFVLMSCNKTKPESDWMLQLYKTHDKDKDNAAKAGPGDYKAQWTTLANSNHKVNGHEEIQYAVEYSLFSFIYMTNCPIINTVATTTSLFTLLNDDTKGVYATFQTTYYDFRIDKVSYVGSMTLTFTKSVVIDNQLTLGNNDVIQWVYSFQEATFSNAPVTTNEWYIDTYTPTSLGDSIGFVQIVHDNAPYGNLQQIPELSTKSSNPNYFNTKALS